MDTFDPTQDALIEAIAFQPVLHFQLQFGASTCVELTSQHRAPLYVAGCDGVWLQQGDAPAVALAAGDVAWLPHAGRHRVFNDALAPVQRFDDLHAAPGSERHGATLNCALGPAPRHTWSGSFYRASSLAAHPVVAALPPMLVLRRSDAEGWLPILARLVAWMADLRGGRGVGLTQTMNALMQHLALTWLRTPARVAAPLAAAMPAVPAPPDPRLHAALHAIHTRPAEPWTLESLAALCHMSRTAFATRFALQMHQPPMRYLARWRLHQATRLLQEQRLTLQQAADAVGYSTGAILARAFKRARSALG